MHLRWIFVADSRRAHQAGAASAEWRRSLLQRGVVGALYLGDGGSAGGDGGTPIYLRVVYD
jgi:hypothetical protein